VAQPQPFDQATQQDLALSVGFQNCKKTGKFLALLLDSDAFSTQTPRV